VGAGTAPPLTAVPEGSPIPSGADLIRHEGHHRLSAAGGGDELDLYAGRGMHQDNDADVSALHDHWARRAVSQEMIALRGSN
jgi:hypothetical protein